MTSTVSEMIAWFKAGPKRTVNGGDWAGGCEAAVVNAGRFTPYAFAYLAAQNSGPLDTDPSTAEPGDLHFWRGVPGYVPGFGWVEQGHVAFEEDGNNSLLMASSHTNTFGHHLGRITLTEFHRLSGLGSKYLGHTRRHGTQQLIRPATAGAGTTIEQDDEEEEIMADWSTMKMEADYGKGAWALVSTSTGKHVHIKQARHLDWLRKLRKGDAATNSAEVSACRGYILAVNPPATVNVDSDALADALGSIADDLVGDELIAAVDAAIAANTSAIATAVADEQYKRMKD